ncbi:MAG: NAD-dependent epimerase/dehydratase family protein [Pseudomonadota bacterium]
MVTGSGLVASAFAPAFAARRDVWVFAAGVSNSGCTAPTEFARERARLSKALGQAAEIGTFVYFGTCSVADPEARATPYVQHKLAMEALARAHPGHLILRLPQTVGRTPNPHTLLNYLYARVSRSEAFTLWRRARRSVIDIADVARIGAALIDAPVRGGDVINIATPFRHPVAEIVQALERAVGKEAVYEIVDRGSEYEIDVSLAARVAEGLGISFGEDYLERVIGKTYGENRG